MKIYQQIYHTKTVTGKQRSINCSIFKVFL